MNVLSLFDGMSCAQIALKEHGWVVDKYYASEIDKFAIKQTQLNFPNTIQLGSVTEWSNWDIDWSSIDLICAGSPCQGFSFAGKQLAFDDPRSKLFFVFVEILNHCKKFNSKVKFLLENVDMKKDHLRIISEYVGLFPVKINSNLVSAQNRERWYWTNIRTKQVGLFDEIYTDISQPEDKGILLKDILQPENEVDGKYYLSEIFIKALIIRKEKRRQIPRYKTGYDKSGTLTAPGNGCGNHSDMDLICVASRGKGDDTNTVTSVSKDDLIIQLNTSLESGGRQPFQHNRVYDLNGIIPALCVDVRSPIIPIDEDTLRRLTPTECARLQTIPEWYKWECSDSQTYRMLGNGWTVDIIKHIFSYL